MDAVAIVLFLVLVVGWAALLFATLFVIGRIIRGIGRGVVSIFRPVRPSGSGRCINPGRRARICPRPQCRKIEYRDAFYCSQCGMRLTETPADSRH